MVGASTPVQVVTHHENGTTVTTTTTLTYTRQQSTESGLDNPFRPDGELSREAECIVRCIREGKPIGTCGLYHERDSGLPDDSVCSLDGSPVKRNGAAPLTNAQRHANGSSKNGAPPKPGVVEVQRGIVVPPANGDQVVEQVVIGKDKKPKCKCCVIQ